MTGSDERSALEILDEGVHLLRHAPAALLAAFYAGSVPYVLGLLYFLSDMSSGAFARRHAGQGALMVACSYLWMKVWQAVFARGLRTRLSGSGAGLSRHEWTRLLLAQCVWQPSSLFALPLAGLVLLPYGWVHAFYQNLSVTGDAADARRQARLWPRQNHVLIAIGSMFGLFVFANFALGLFWLPGLLKSLLGIETVFSRSPRSLMNTTLLSCAAGLAYLAVSPVMKAAYVLRCFYGDALKSGEDLRMELRRLAPAAEGRNAVALAAALFCLWTAPAAAAVRPSSPVPSPQRDARSLVPSDRLERAIRDVLERREFAWRLPRAAPEVDEEDKGLLVRFFEAIGDTVGGWMRSIGRLIDRLGEWFDKVFGSRSPYRPARSRDIGWVTSVQGLLAVLLTVVACCAALFFWRSRGRRAVPLRILPEPAPVAPDVFVDESAAAEIPGDQWLQHARALAGQGDLRRAVRALYLACLSDLSRRELLNLGRAKSNRDYERELRRRGSTVPHLPALFEENVRQFERVWYGRHEATEEMVGRFVDRLGRMQAGARP